MRTMTNTKITSEDLKIKEEYDEFRELKLLLEYVRTPEQRSDSARGRPARIRVAGPEHHRRVYRLRYSDHSCVPVL